jgi:hypothetical protein
MGEGVENIEKDFFLSVSIALATLDLLCVSEGNRIANDWQ